MQQAKRAVKSKPREVLEGESKLREVSRARMPFTIRVTLGYDEVGFCEELIAEVDKEVMRKGTWVRAEGRVICEKCGFAYREHPPVQGALFMTRTCTGLVKL